METMMDVKARPDFLSNIGTCRSVAFLSERYLFYMENVRDFSMNTIKSRRCYLKEFSRYFADMSPTEITNQHLDIYFLHLKARVSLLTNKPISYGSLNNRKRAIRVFLRWLKESKDLPLKVNLSEIYITRETDSHTKLLAFEDIDYVIERIGHRQDKLMIRTMYDGGLRISELAKVKIEHLRGKRLEVVGKGGRRRVTFISDELANDLRTWMQDRCWYTGYTFRPILHGVPGERYKHLDSIRQRIKRWFYKIMGIRMHPHQLRHSFARKLLEGGCSIRAIQKLLGHKNIETTMTYLGVDDDWLEREYVRSVHHNNPIATSGNS